MNEYEVTLKLKAVECFNVYADSQDEAFDVAVEQILENIDDVDFTVDLIEIGYFNRDPLGIEMEEI